MPIFIGKPRKTGRYVGERNVPQDVKRRRHQVSELMRRMGSPILVKHRYNDLDVQKGTAVKSPVFDDVYDQTRNEDPLSYGVGYVSVELSPNEWYDANGNIEVSSISPGAGWTQAPLYRGFGPGNLTWIIEPDRAEDFYKAFTGGPLFKVQTATAVAPWYPNIDDNDLLINVELGPGDKVVNTAERYEAKMVNPISMRGTDNRGRGEAGYPGNRHTVNQQFEMALIPENNVLYQVETDR